MKVIKKPIIVEADGPLGESRMVTTAHGRVRAEAGDYVITDPATGDTWPIKPDLFNHTYRAASEDGDEPKRKTDEEILERIAMYEADANKEVGGGTRGSVKWLLNMAKASALQWVLGE